jgi:MFS family permease
MVQWLVCIIASIGFAFDIYELLMAPLVMPPAILHLVGASQGTPEFERWFAILFYVPALVGGVFGLLGGYLTDLLGRRRVLTWSILLYAVSACLAGFSTSIYMLLFFRCTTFVGVCVEFVAAVAWLAELFPDPRRRELVLGYTQAFSSLGGVMVTAANGLAIRFAEVLPAIHGDHDVWRYTLISGLIPAFPLIIIRPFLPESPAWAEKKKAGTLKRPNILQLFAPELRRTTIVTTLMFACSYGAAFGALQHTPRLVREHPEVTSKAEGKDPTEKRKIIGAAATTVNGFQEMGGLAGRMFLAFIILHVASQRRLIRIFQVPGMIILPLVYFFLARDNAEMENLALLNWGMLAVGFFTVGQFSFWGNYLPRVYPLHLRGTGEGFAANIGGRMIGTSAAALTTWLVTRMPADVVTSDKIAIAAGCVGLGVYVVGFLASFWLPEPKRGELID